MNIICFNNTFKRIVSNTERLHTENITLHIQLVPILRL